MYKSWWRKLDYLLLFLMIILTIFGFIIISSANRENPESNELNRQVIYFFVGLIFMGIFTAIDYELLAGFERYIYVVNVLLLIVVLFYGKTVMGATRWISLGGFTFQPSEFVKVFVIISIAVHLSREDALKPEKLVGTLLYVGLPMALIISQPDLGTALVLVAILMVMLFVRGFNPIYILGFCALGIGLAPLFLKEYQKQRILSFLNPESDPTGSGWTIIQSIVSIGSGKFWGKGLFLGTQTQLQFVPEHSTDFVFSVVGEELGFVGAASLIILYFILLWKMIRIARESKDMVGSLIATGICAMFFFHIFVNVGMTTGLMPVTGLPLPFISYGGSSLITNMIAIGLLLNISLRRELFFKK